MTEHQPITDVQGTAHYTVAYQFAKTVGCSCGWVRKDILPDFHDDLIVEHLKAVRPTGNVTIVGVNPDNGDDT